MFPGKRGDPSLMRKAGSSSGSSEFRSGDEKHTVPQ